MKYGCIGEHLGHSFSKEIHNAIADYEYIIKEIPKDELEHFAKDRDFLGINVTIPYKELIMPYLDFIDPDAEKIGAVNTVVNRDGRLYGYNTDFYGMTALIHHAGIDAVGKKVAILGSGGTSKTALSVFTALGADKIIRVSRTKSDDTVTYDELYALHSDTEIIINTTPVGMFPRCDASPVELDKFRSLCGVIDVVYNPLKTKLVLDAEQRGIPTSGGLYMLVAQAVRASEIFLGTHYEKDVLDRVYEKTLSQKENIVLIGMPSCGKTTVGEILSKMISRPVIDTDDLIRSAQGREISDIFASCGEEYFRDAESAAVTEASMKPGVIIATGGGAILREENVTHLKQNGILYFLDRSLEHLVPTADRPTAHSRDMIEKRYNERYGIYTAVCDKKINSDRAPGDVAERIIEDFCK